MAAKAQEKKYKTVERTIERLVDRNSVHSYLRDGWKDTGEKHGRSGTLVRITRVIKEQVEATEEKSK